MNMLIFISVLILLELSVFITMWLLSRRPVNLTVVVRIADDGDDPDEDEIEAELIPDERPIVKDAARFN